MLLGYFSKARDAHSCHHIVVHNVECVFEMNEEQVENKVGL